MWVSTFDIKVERMKGGCSIKTKSLMEFQEDQNHATNTMIITVRRRKSRTWFYENIHIEMMPVDVNKK